MQGVDVIRCTRVCACALVALTHVSTYLPYNRSSAPHQRPDTSAQDMAREMDVIRRFEEVSAAEHRMEASIQKLLLLCERVKLVCARIPGAAAAERAAGAVHTLSLPHAEACEHKVMTGHDDVAWRQLVVVK